MTYFDLKENKIKEIYLNNQYKIINSIDVTIITNIQIQIDNNFLKLK